MELSFSPSFSPDAKRTCFKILEKHKRQGGGFDIGIVKSHHSKTYKSFDTFQMPC